MAAYEAGMDWVNEPIGRLGRFELRRIDVVIALAGIGVTAWYAWTGGWLGALQGGMMYVLVAMAALWMF